MGILWLFGYGKIKHLNILIALFLAELSQICRISMQMASNIGTLCGNLVGALMRTILKDEQLYAWGWRIPFLSGILIAFVGVYLRLYGEESNIHTANDEKEDTHWKEVFRKENLPALGAATFTPMVSLLSGDC